jgi:hypothetical protein
MDGLLSKVFMWNDETETVINTYVWDSEEAARAFFTSPEVKALIIELYGVEPHVCSLPRCRRLSTIGSPRLASAAPRPFTASDPPPFPAGSAKRMKGLEPSTFCMAITAREATGADWSRHSA